MAQTVSDGYHDRPSVFGARTDTPVLRVILHAWRPSLPTSRHHLYRVNRVEFGRGPTSASRVTDGTAEVLRLRLPDPMISSDHGRLELRDGRWFLDDPHSKNGALVAGRPTRCAPVRPGEFFELGHTLFRLDEGPWTPEEPADLMSNQLEAASPELSTFVPTWRQQLEAMARLASTDLPVLLLGESGTGKEVLARALHRLSERTGPFVAVNCGAISPQLVEAELFGHRKGAFSGAATDRPGYLRAAHGGTLLLDEVGDLPQAAQAALLRVLQEREVVPVGDERPVAIDVRICAATHRDLEAKVADGTFRHDLYARLLGLSMTVPALRDRIGDLGWLVARLLAQLPGGDGATFTPAAAYALASYPWPLNVRELELTLATALARADGNPIDCDHLPPRIARPPGGPGVPAPTPVQHDPSQREALVNGLTRHRGNVAALARELGVHREQVHRTLRRLGIDPKQFRS